MILTQTFPCVLVPHPSIQQLKDGAVGLHKLYNKTIWLPDVSTGGVLGKDVLACFLATSCVDHRRLPHRCTPKQIRQLTLNLCPLESCRKCVFVHDMLLLENNSCSRFVICIFITQSTVLPKLTQLSEKLCPPPWFAFPAENNSLWV